MPDMLVLYKKDKAVSKLMSDASRTAFFENLRRIVAKAVPDLDGDPEKVAMMAFGFDFCSGNAPDLQFLIMMSKTEARDKNMITIFKSINDGINEFIREIQTDSQADSMFWSLDKMRVEVWPIMPDGSWKSIS